MLEPDVGDEVIYRYRDYDTSECVRNLELDNRKKTPRYVVEFLTGPKAFTIENIPARRLRGYWSDVAEYDQLLGNWERIDDYSLTKIEQFAVETVFSQLIPENIANWLWSPVRFAIQITDNQGLESIIGMEISALLEQGEHFTLPDGIRGSPELTLLVAEHACRVAPFEVLQWVLDDEADYAKRCRHGKPTTDLDGNPTTTSPEWEHRMYLEYGRPHHEQLRSWCGQRAVSIKDKLENLEHQNRELDELARDMYEELKRLGRSSIDLLHFSQKYAKATKPNPRPAVDRPLEPDELPVRYVVGPRRWGY